MKKLILLAVGSLVLFANACKEVGPAIDLTPEEIPFDTSYSDATPAPEQKRILVEEYTGVKCPNCPSGTTILKNYASAHPDRIVIVALHSGSLTDPISGKSKYNFSNPEVQNMVNNYLGGNTPPKPAAAIDRIDRGGAYGMFAINKNQWTSYLDERLPATSPVNISVTSRYDSALQRVIVRAKVVYTQTVTKKQNISIWVVENKIVDAQYDGTVTIENYEHNHIFRDFITPVGTGARILDSATKQPGLVFETQRVYQPKYLVSTTLDKWNLDNCKIVVVVHNDEPGDKQVAQVAEVKLK